jgi:putative GTP pyrophosphokinase
VVPGEVRDTASWAEDYERIRPQFVAFTDALSHELEMLLTGSTVSVAQLESRTKTVRSFAEKIDRKSKYVDPLREITDLSGLRVIVPGPADITPVGELIRADFDIDEKNSLSSGADNDPDRFGYRAEHYVVRLRSEQCRLAAWSKFGGFSAEIQVRTVMQHAWAAVDHKIRYKGSTLPPSLQRRLYRLSALLELADEQFAALQVNSTELSESYARSMAQGDLDVDLDALSLMAYIDESKIDRYWASAASRLGYSRPSVDRMDPAAVLETMRAVNIRTLAAFQGVFESAEQWGETALGRILEHIRDGSPPVDKFAAIMAYRDDVLKLLLLFNARSEPAIKASDFRIDIREGLLRAVAS